MLSIPNIVYYLTCLSSNLLYLHYAVCVQVMREWTGCAAERDGEWPVRPVLVEMFCLG